ncbi:DNA repair protein RadA [Pararhodospirillum oryzae]|uniref:DNA repair protein RadA n=1 Tax=Pararhodospirillum oryzae TaxID=478448 RepID=A0A512HA95_9PROT|nr:DNA repair protein RadA [Pararhodospirillum oryzae]GEO82377.1 DNA repair protein RadA [Pararhodospirillum oryzae]
MARPSARFVCQSCGAVSPRWVGRCESCGAWNSLQEEAPAEPLTRGQTGGKGGRLVPLVGLEGADAPPARLPTGLAELDRVSGGGLVPGSALLVGGDPGIGKSTLMLQVSAALALGGARSVYLSGEEAVEQVRLRARRLGLAHAPVALASATNLRDILATLDAGAAPDVVIIDSIQTMVLDTLDSAPGTVSQVRAGAHELIRAAKRRGFVLFLIGHVTKDGQLAGPRVMEHMVDAVLYFEGERGHPFRILRAVKNRFGATDEIGVFEMSDRGLVEVPNPSALFLAERRGNVTGSCVFAGMEGTRPMLVEIQALVAPSGGGTPRRAVVGWDAGRLAMVLAVLEARCGLALGGNDVYLNVAGGLRITEPAADLAVAAALLSSFLAVPVPADMVVFGEVGLSGEVRAVAHGDTRLKEAAKLGFAQALTPARPRDGARRGGSGRDAREGLTMREIGHLQDLAALFGPPAPESTPPARTPVP